MKQNRQVVFFLIALASLLVFTSCASIPAEAPELSTELGNRINAIQDANLTLLHRFFDLKRAEVDRFIQEEWLPVFADEIFKDPKIDQVWKIVVRENNATDRLEFLVRLGPRLQGQINQKRLQLIKPLDDIERRIEEKIREEYAQARAINNTITSFLFSASKVAENRNRYLEMVGVTDEKVGETIDKVNDVVNDLLASATTAEDTVGEAEKYLNELREIKKSLTTNNKEK